MQAACAPQKFLEPSVPYQFAAALTATGTDVDQIVRCADDLFVVLDYEQGIAFVAQVVHHAHEPPNVARMQSDAWFVHDEECVHQRCAETGGEIDPLHFAAAQGASRTIEGEITDADFAKVTEARANFVAQHFRSAVMRRDFDVPQ